LSQALLKFSGYGLAERKVWCLASLSGRKLPRFKQAVLQVVQRLFETSAPGDESEVSVGSCSRARLALNLIVVGGG
jgi:hypothetical protein